MTTTLRSPATAPGARPLLGHALEMKRRPGDLLLSLQRTGEPVCALRLGRRRVYVVNDPGLIRRVQREPDVFARGGPVTERFRRMFGNGLGTSEGEFHRRQRALIQPAFHHTGIVRHAAGMSALAAAAAASWHDGQRLAVEREMDDLALANVTQAIFAADTPLDRRLFMAATTVVLGGLFRRVTGGTGPAARLPTPAEHRYRRAEKHLRRTIERVIADYRADGADRGDLLSMMMLARDDDGTPAMTDRQLHDEVMTFFIGGSNTVSNTLAWTFHEVSVHPGVEERLHAEVDAVLDGRPAGYDDVRALAYTRRVLTETLRVRTQGLFLSKVTARDAELGGYLIPAGSPVLYSFHALNHNPDIHPDPESFLPDRWLPARVRDLPRGAFMPFGVGPHACIGDQFAWTEMIITLATIAARWRLAAVPGHTPRPRPAITMPVDSLPMIAHRRSAR
ncbi:cytochrome P450 [Actinomadura sp. NPDC047616]|uniref:cytochrome P450 n=1 Tax=Actinomadura sp. NPDC047616 TaxID=3155914 RepID=UPI0033E98998